MVSYAVKRPGKPPIPYADRMHAIRKAQRCARALGVRGSALPVEVWFCGKVVRRYAWDRLRKKVVRVGRAGQERQGVSAIARAGTANA